MLDRRSGTISHVQIQWCECQLFNLNFIMAQFMPRVQAPSASPASNRSAVLNRSHGTVAIRSRRIVARSSGEDEPTSASVYLSVSISQYGPALPCVNGMELDKGPVCLTA